MRRETSGQLIQRSGLVAVRAGQNFANRSEINDFHHLPIGALQPVQQ